MRIHLEGNKVDCPNPACGKTANLVDGEFATLADTLKIISAPDITYAILRQFQEIAESLQENEINSAEAVVKAQALNPELGMLMAKFTMYGVPWLGLLLTLIALYLTYDGNVSSSEFQSRMLDLERQQLSELQSLNQKISQDQQPDNMNAQRRSPSTPKAHPDGAKPKSKSERRKQVNKERRDALKERRRQFSPKYDI